MRLSSALLMVAATGLLASAPVIAQQKLAGTMACGQPDPLHMIPVGDLPDHALGLEQFKCNWTQPMELAGDRSKEGQSTETVEASGSKLQTHGRHVTTMQSGDRLFVSYRGVTTTRDNAPLDSKGSWVFTGGTGKLKGISGKGSYSCSPWAGGLSCDITGDYQLAK